MLCSVLLPPSYSLETGSPLDPELGWQPSGPGNASVSTRHGSEVIGTYSHAQALYWGFELRSSGLHSKCSSSQSPFPRLQLRALIHGSANTSTLAGPIGGLSLSNLCYLESDLILLWISLFFCPSVPAVSLLLG